MAYNPFDEVIENDPAYRMVNGGETNNPVREIPIAQSPIESQFAPVTDPQPAIDLDAYALQELNKLVDKAVLPQYRLATGKTLEENFGKDIMNRKLAIGLAFKEAGLPVDPNKESLTSAELQDPVIRPLLQKYGYEPQSISEGLERTVETFLRNQREAREKRLRGESLTPMEEIDASLPMALLDALDFTGLVGLGLKGAFKVGKAGLKYLLNESAKGTSKNEALKNFTELFPQDAKALQMSAVQEEKARIGGGSGIPLGIGGTDDFLGRGDRIALAPERNGTGGGPSSLYRQAPSEKNNIQYGAWRRETIQTYLDELRKQAGDPNAKFDKSIIIAELNNLFESLGVPRERLVTSSGKNTTYFERAFGKKKKDGTIERQFDDYFYPEKQGGGTTPSWAKPNYKPDQPGNPTYQFLKNKVAEYMTSFPDAQKPSSREIFNYIQQTETDEVKNWFAGAKGTKKGELSKISDIINENRRAGVEGVDELLRPTKISSTKLLLDDLFEKDPAFKSSFDAAVSQLQNDNFLNRVVNAWKSNLAKYKDEFGRPILSLDNFTRYGRENNLWPERMNQMEKVSYPPNYKSSKDLNREVDRLGNMLISGPDSRKYKKFGTQIRIEDDMYSYLTHKFRTIRDFDRSEELGEDVGISANDFMLTYVMPFKGKDRAETLKNLKEEYTDFGKYWEPMEREFDEYVVLLDEAMDGLEASGKYTTDELNKIRKSLAPNRSHLFPVNQANREKRFLNLSGDGRFIEVQPVYINNSLEPIYRNLLTKVFNKLETADSIAQLKVQKPKFFGLSKNRSEYANLDISEEAFKNTFTNPGDYNQFNYLNFVYKQIDAAMKDKGIISYQIFNPKNKNIIKGFEVKEGEQGDLLIVGSDKQFTPADHINRALKQLEESGIPDVFNPTKKTSILKFKKRGGISMVKGGMAIGGQNFTENMNKQDFIPDPGIEGMSAFQQAVQSGNLQALNIPKIFKGLGEAFGVYTPKKVISTPAAPIGMPIDKSDFPLQSFTLEKLSNSKTNQAKPQDWINELQGGTNKAPTSEIVDSGIFQYLTDYEKYFPGQKISKAKLLEVFENNPISNLKVRIKGAETGDPAYDSYMGRPRHENVGSAPLDNVAEDYREVIIEAGTLPGQTTGDEFVNSSHFTEKNVLAFGRVGTYTNSNGEKVAVIQEMQTDYLTQVRKEQELLDAEIQRLTNQKAKAEERLATANNEYDRENAENTINRVNSKLPTLLRLQESKLIKPYPNDAGAELIPALNKQLQDLQSQIRDLAMQGARGENPEFVMQMSRLEAEQRKVLDQLLDLNRASEFDILAKDIKIPDLTNRDEVAEYIAGDRVVDMKNLRTFAPTPLNKQGDYVDAIIKAVIKDAENRGINRITIMPADIGANQRWSKDTEGAKKKFRNLYDGVGIQTLKNIAKKYGGTVEEEFILDTTKANIGLKFFNKNVDGEFDLLRDLSPTARSDTDAPGGVQLFLDQEITRIAKDYGPNEVVIRREIAPGQTVEFFVEMEGNNYRLVPLGDGDRAENATIIIEEYNPQQVKMNVLVLPESNKDKPMYLFKKKKGGIMLDDRLVSITDIYGDY